MAEGRAVKVLVTGAEVHRQEPGGGARGAPASRSPRSTSTAAPTLWRRRWRGATSVFHLAGVNRPENARSSRPATSARWTTLLLRRRRMTARRATRRRSCFPPRSRPSWTTPTARASWRPRRRSRRYAERRRAGGHLPASRTSSASGAGPNYNSVVATFCHNIAHGLPIAISDPARVVELVHVDDVVAAFMTHLDGHAARA